MKIGFIGTGNMASAIMGGIIKKQIIGAEEIIGADLSAQGRERAKSQFGIHVTDSNKEVVEKAEVIVLSVKPQFYADVIHEIRGSIRDNQLIITIAPGKTLAPEPPEVETGEVPADGDGCEPLSDVPEDEDKRV